MTVHLVSVDIVAIYFISIFEFDVFPCPCYRHICSVVKIQSFYCNKLLCLFAIAELLKVVFWQVYVA